MITLDSLEILSYNYITFLVILLTAFWCEDAM